MIEKSPSRFEVVWARHVDRELAEQEGEEFLVYDRDQHRSASYGKAYGHGPDAGWMPYDEVDQIIRRCIDEYLKTNVA